MKRHFTKKDTRGIVNLICNQGKERKRQIKATSKRWQQLKSDNTKGWRNRTAMSILYTPLVAVSIGTIIWKTVWHYIVKSKM